MPVRQLHSTESAALRPPNWRDDFRWGLTVRITGRVARLLFFPQRARRRASRTGDRHGAASRTRPRLRPRSRSAATPGHHQGRMSGPFLPVRLSGWQDLGAAITSARNPAHSRTADARFTRDFFLRCFWVCLPDLDYFRATLSRQPLVSFCFPARRQFNTYLIRAPAHRQKAHAKFPRDPRRVRVSFQRRDNFYFLRRCNRKRSARPTLRPAAAGR
jgi:hypothetical protein